MTESGGEGPRLLRGIIDRFLRKEKAVNSARRLVDHALASADRSQLRAGVTDASEIIEKFLTHGNLTTSGSNLNAEEGEANDFFGQCDYLTELVESALRQIGTGSRLIKSGVHSFLAIHVDNVDVFVDPAIGEFIAGHNHIFVGTKEDLKRLITTSHSQGQIINVDQFKDPLIVNSPLPASPTPKQILKLLWRV